MFRAINFQKSFTTSPFGYKISHQLQKVSIIPYSLPDCSFRFYLNGKVIHGSSNHFLKQMKIIKSEINLNFHYDPRPRCFSEIYERKIKKAMMAYNNSPAQELGNDFAERK